MFYHAQRSHLLQSLDRLCYVYIAYSYLVTPTLTGLITRLIAQYRITLLIEVQPSHSPRFHLVVWFGLSVIPYIFTTQGSGVLLDFVGRATQRQRLQWLIPDMLLMACQLIQLTIAYETTCWAPEVPDPLFAPPAQLQDSAAPAASPQPRLRTRPRRTRSTQSSQPRTTRAGYRDVLVRRSRHIRTSTASFGPNTPIIELPLRTLIRLLSRSSVPGEDAGLPGPATELRRRPGFMSQLIGAAMRMRIARQGGAEGTMPGAMPPSTQSVTKLLWTDRCNESLVKISLPSASYSQHAEPTSKIPPLLED